MNKQDLLEEIKVALQDEFLAEIVEEEGSLVMRFFSGEKFRVRVEEVK